MIEFLLKYGNLILVLVILVVALVAAIINFFKLPPKQRLKNVKEWLLLVVMQAEQIYGGGTGVIKLRYAYEEFITKFPDLAKILPFEKFSEMVDDALDTLEELIEDNPKLASIVEHWRK